MTKNKLSWKQILVVASTLFGMIFGAGNLIFPVHMGQLAGNNFSIATFGFCLTAVVIPILGIIAIGFSESKGLFSLSKNVSDRFAYIFTMALYIAIGPLCAIPRSPSIAFGAGLSAIIGDSINIDIAFLIFSLIFFSLCLFFSLRPSGLTTYIGKVINPIFLIFLFSLLVVAFINPMGDPSSVTPTQDYAKDPFFLGFVEGYGTMDALACLAFGIVIIDVIKKAGIKKPAQITKNLITPSIITGALMILIYVLWVLMGVESRGMFEISSNGSTALSQISNNYFSIWGNILLTTIVSLAALKTCIGLVTATSATFYEMLPGKKISYKRWCVICVAISFTLSNIGLDNILQLTTPVLSFLYPIAIVLIILAFVGPLFSYSKIVFKWTIYITCIPALLDFLNTLPLNVIEVLKVQGFLDLANTYIPFFDIGFGWVVPALIGFIIGIISYIIKKGKDNNESIKKN